MSIWILYCPTQQRAVLYDSISETAFGHGFNEGPQSYVAAESFLRWLKRDPRPYSTSYMAAQYMEWFHLTHCNLCGEAAFNFNDIIHLNNESFDEALGSGGNIWCETCAQQSNK